MPLSDARRKTLNVERANTLVPELRDILLEGLDILEENGWSPLVTQALRTVAQQTAYYSQGRNPLKETNRLRLLAGLDPIDEEENVRKVTWTMKSNHLGGKAFDLVNINEGKADWEDMEFFQAANKVFTEYDVKWGGLWTTGKKDYPHFELS